MQFIKNATAQKLRGGYYTPEDLAQYVSKFVVRDTTTTILEPSCGDGAFLRAIGAVSTNASLSVTGFELDPEEALKAHAAGENTLNIKTNIHQGDFLNWALNQLQFGEKKFDGIVGNPPFIRYQYLPTEFQILSESIFNHFNLKFTKHTNAWVPFVIASIGLLTRGGRLGMVLPAEIIHVMHAQSLRTFLGNQCRKIMIVDPRDLWFEGTLQGAVILLAEKKENENMPSEGLGVEYVSGRKFTKDDPRQSFERIETINGKTVVGKWTRALLTDMERGTIGSLVNRLKIKRFKQIARVDVGIVTGANKFFLVDDQTVEDFELQQWAHPMFGRSDHCPGIIYDKAQHRRNADDGKPTNFLWFGADAPELSPRALEYIRMGEKQDLQSRYKCRIRSPWYRVPSVYATELGMLKRSHNAPRLIRNSLEAYTTDTAYRIRSEDYSADQLTYSFFNPLTALSAELEGRHYGGGVLELVPSEIERLFIPIVDAAKEELRALDNLIRTSDAVDALETQSPKILGKLGASSKEQEIILEAWSRLKSRRQRQAH